MRTHNKINASHVRLILAVCLCLFSFIATTTSPNEGNGCSEHDHGRLMLINTSAYRIMGFLSGPDLSDFRVGVYDTRSETYTLKTGVFKYVLYQIAENNEKTRIRVGTFVIYPHFTTELTYK